MGKYYCVESCYYDSGFTDAKIVEVIEDEEKPLNMSMEHTDCDVYHDWFESEDEAKDFIEGVIAESEGRW